MTEFETVLAYAIKREKDHFNLVCIRKDDMKQRIVRFAAPFCPEAFELFETISIRKEPVEVEIPKNSFHYDIAEAK